MGGWIYQPCWIGEAQSFFPPFPNQNEEKAGLAHGQLSTSTVALPPPATRGASQGVFTMFVATREGNDAKGDVAMHEDALGSGWHLPRFPSVINCTDMTPSLDIFGARA